MRKPVFANYFNVRTKKGLSNFLAGQCKLQEVVFKLLKFNDLRFISAGAKILGMVYNVYDLGDGRYYKQGYKSYGVYNNYEE